MSDSLAGDAQLRQILDLLPTGVFRNDAAGNCTYVNKLAAEIVGLTEAEVLGCGWAKNLHPDDRERVTQEARAARVEARAFQSEYRFLHPGGRIVWARGQFVPQCGADGCLSGFVGSIADITPHKIAEQRLRQSEKRYQALADNSAVGVWHITPDGKTLYANPAALRMAELDEGELNNDFSIYDLLTPESRQVMAAEHAKRPGGIASVYEVELKGRRGTRRQILASGAPMFDADGNLTGMVATSIDITERKRVEEALRQNETRLRVLIEQAPAILWTTDASLCFTSSTGSGLSAMGLQIGQVVGMPVEEFFATDPASPAVEAHLKALVGERITYEAKWQGRSYHSHVEPLRGTGGTIEGVIGVALDITDRKKAEDDVRESRDTLEKRVRERTDELTRANAALTKEVEERRIAEENLRQSQARYASILNSQQTLVSRSDTRGRITYVNAAHERTFGSKVGDSVLVHVHPEDIETTNRAMEGLARPPYICTLEQRCEVHGHWRTFLWQVGVIRDRQGQVAEYQGVGFDITDLKRAEELLRESERKARVSATQASESAAMARDSALQARTAAERERRAADEARQVAEFNRRLALEVDHRVRNNLAGLMSLVSAMKESERDVRHFASAIESRLLAMAHAHQLLAEVDWRPVLLKKLVASLLDTAKRLSPGAIDAHIAGPNLQVSSRRAPALLMILMEWFTNSCKYGACSVTGGKLSVTWEAVTDRTDPRPRARLRWIESGGPAPAQPVHPSLGTSLVQGFAKLELNGTVELRYPLRGADHVLEFLVE